MTFYFFTCAQRCLCYNPCLHCYTGANEGTAVFIRAIVPRHRNSRQQQLPQMRSILRMVIGTLISFLCEKQSSKVSGMRRAGSRKTFLPRGFLAFAADAAGIGACRGDTNQRGHLNIFRLFRRRLIDICDSVHGKESNLAGWICGKWSCRHWLRQGAFRAWRVHLFIITVLC